MIEFVSIQICVIENSGVKRGGALISVLLLAFCLGGDFPPNNGGALITGGPPSLLDLE